MKFPRRVEYLKDEGQRTGFWEEYWHKVGIQIKQVEKDPVTAIARKWIEDTTGEGKCPKILDGGCGSGRYLIYFGELGYDITGADFSANAVKAAKKINANLKVVQATVLDLPFASQSLDYYLSFGVLEHFIDGPEQGLREAHRILKEGGMLLLSVPYMSNLRLLEEHLYPFIRKIRNRSREAKTIFYEYMFTRGELVSILNSLGFEVLRDYPLNQELGLLRALSFFRSNRILNYLVINLAKMSKFFIPHFCAHKILLICKK